MSLQAVQQAIETCDAKLRGKGYSVTCATDMRTATFHSQSAGVTIVVKDGNCGCSAVDIDVSPMPQRLVQMTKHNCCTGRTDEIVYAMDRGAEKWVRCCLLPNKKMGVVIAPHQVGDVVQIVSHIMRAF